MTAPSKAEIAAALESAAKLASRAAGRINGMIARRKFSKEELQQANLELHAAFDATERINTGGAKL